MYSGDGRIALKAQTTEERKTLGEITMLSTTLVIITDIRGKGIIGKSFIGFWFPSKFHNYKTGNKTRLSNN